MPLTVVILITLSNITNFFLSKILFLPLITFFFFFFVITFYLYFSLRNIFKIFFFTEILLLIIVIFLLQIIAFYPEASALNFFYSQLILATAAAEGALFLGLFSYLYDQQFSN
jgi:NADH:ubiquinone oxidoreductase subunit K